MKTYIKENFIPIVIGIAIGLCYSITLEAIDDVIIKIALINKR